MTTCKRSRGGITLTVHIALGSQILLGGVGSKDPEGQVPYLRVGLACQKRAKGRAYRIHRLRTESFPPRSSAQRNQERAHASHVKVYVFALSSEILALAMYP